MKKNSFRISEVSFKQKIALILFGLFLFFVLLETGLRLGGFILLSIQEHRNLQSIKQKGAYRIMCLGESTTAGEWPLFLEKILNQHNIGIKFSVVDKGVPGTNTSAILAQLERNLDEYKPDMVISMMGINDSNPQLSSQNTSTRKGIFSLSSFKVYKLSRFIYLSGLAKINVLSKISGWDRNTERTGFAGHSFAPSQISDVVKDQQLETESSKNKTKLNPAEVAVCLEAGKAMLEAGNCSGAQRQFQEVLASDPKNLQALVSLGRLYRERGLFLPAAQVLQTAIAIDPRDPEACMQLGRLNRDYYRHLDEAEDWFRKAISAQPDCYDGYYELGVLYGDRKKLDQAQAVFTKALELFPDSTEFHFKLGWILREQGKLAEAEAMFKEAMRRDMNNTIILRALASLSQDADNYRLEQEFYDKINILKSDYYPLTVDNYRRIARILRTRNIKFVCVQYPVRSIQPLKDIFYQEEDNIIFVDNEKLFKQAIYDQGFKAIFRDMFAGDFGHATAKGNELLAGNIANAILKEVFNKS